jgi:probable rRNA maturation factor
VRAAALRDLAVTVRFVGMREGRRLNSRFRGKDRATNVLTFVYDDEHRLTGDLVLCAPVLRREAQAGGKTVIAHCAHLLVHGMLHLQGYDHDRDADARRMQRREAQLLAALGYPDPYAT